MICLGHFVRLIDDVSSDGAVGERHKLPVHIGGELLDGGFAEGLHVGKRSSTNNENLTTDHVHLSGETKRVVVDVVVVVLVV